MLEFKKKKSHSSHKYQIYRVARLGIEVTFCQISFWCYVYFSRYIQAWGGINRVLCDDSHANITDGVWSKMHVPSVLRRVFSNYDVCPLIYDVCSLYGVILTLFKAKPVLSCIFIF